VGTSTARLFEIFSQDPKGPKAHALRYCGPITSATIEAVDLLDPVLLHPEIVKAIRHPNHARHANRVVRFLKQVCSTASHEALRTAAQQAVGLEALASFAHRWVERADVFPPPPFPASAGVVPLTSAAQMIAAGKTFDNYLRGASKIAEVLLGYAYHYVVEHRAEENAKPERYAVEITPLSNGGWVVSTIEGSKGERVSAEAKAAVLKRMLALGALAPANPARYPEAKALEATLGIRRFDPLDLPEAEHKANDAA